MEVAVVEPGAELWSALEMRRGKSERMMVSVNRSFNKR